MTAFLSPMLYSIWCRTHDNFVEQDTYRPWWANWDCSWSRPGEIEVLDNHAIYYLDGRFIPPPWTGTQLLREGDFDRLMKFEVTTLSSGYLILRDLVAKFSDHKLIVGQIEGSMVQFNRDDLASVGIDSSVTISPDIPPRFMWWRGFEAVYGEILQTRATRMAIRSIFRPVRHNEIEADRVQVLSGYKMQRDSSNSKELLAAADLLEKAADIIDRDGWIKYDFDAPIRRISL